MVTRLEEGVLRAAEPGCCSAPGAARGLGASGWVQPWVGCGEAVLRLGRGFCSPWGETRSCTIVEVVVVPLQPWGHCWPMSIPSQEMGWDCANMGKDNPAPERCQTP